MRLRDCHYLLLLAGFVLAASTTTANAYVGPGAGLSAIGSLLGVVAALFLAVAGFVWYPVKRLLKRGKPAAPGPAAEPSPNPKAASE